MTRCCWKNCDKATSQTNYWDLLTLGYFLVKPGKYLCANHARKFSEIRLVSRVKINAKKREQQDIDSMIRMQSLISPAYLSQNCVECICDLIELRIRPDGDSGRDVIKYKFLPNSFGKLNDHERDFINELDNLFGKYFYKSTPVHQPRLARDVAN